jgi:hypothetical protein
LWKLGRASDTPGSVLGQAAHFAELPAEEKAALAAWLNEREMDGWDRQRRQDFSSGGRGMRVVEKVKADIRDDKFRPMSDKVT